VKRLGRRWAWIAFSALLAGALLVPLPYSVVAPCELQPRGATAVYVGVAGELKAIFVRPGEWVEQGQPLAELASLELDTVLAQLCSQQQLLEAQQTQLARQQFRDASAARRMGTVREAIESLRQQIARRQAERAELVLRAPCSGVVIPPPEHDPADSPDAAVPRWTGTPLDPSNVGCYLEAGTLLCHVGDAAQLDAVVVIDQGDVEQLREPSRATLVLEHRPGQRWHGFVRDIARQELDTAPRSLSTKAGGDLPTVTDAAGRERPQATVYQARIALHDPHQTLRPGMRGGARIDAGRLTLAQRVWRFLAATFRARR
jgi:putative peptide zinc metalloprotease protein